jgi:hypothetical protein
VDRHDKLDFDILCRLLEDFAGGIVSGRLVWDVNMHALQATATLVQQLLQKVWNGKDWDAHLFLQLIPRQSHF